MKPRTFFLTVFFTVLLIFIILVAGIIIITLAFVSLEPDVDDQSVLKISLSGKLEEYSPDKFLSNIMQSDNTLSLKEITFNIRKAKNDDRISGIYLKISPVNAGWAKVQEIKSVLDDFKKSGKFVFGYLVGGGEKEYYILTGCDKMYVPPESSIMLDGIVIRKTYIKSLLEKIKLEPVLIKAGKFKSAGEQVTREDMSDNDREQLLKIIDDIYSHFLNCVSERRNIPVNELKTSIDKTIYTSKELKDARLVDELMYEDEVIELLKKKNGDSENLTSVSINNYMDVEDEYISDNASKTIAIIYATGAIYSVGDNKTALHTMMGENIIANKIVKSIRSAVNNEDVKAIVLRVDSPGGDGIASDLIWREIAQAKKKKPVIASMSDTCASGGYYIASPCTKIVAHPSTVTGSIGVFGMLLNAKELYNFLGLNHDQIKKGTFADIGTTTRKPTYDEVQRISILIEDFYRTFVKKVADNRNKTWEEINAIAEGRIWSGSEAKKLGLVDKVGNLQDAITLAKVEAKINKSEPVELLTYPKEKSILEAFLGDDTEVRLNININDLLPYAIKESVHYINFLLCCSETKLLTALPYHIEFH